MEGNGGANVTVSRTHAGFSLCFQIEGACNPCLFKRFSLLSIIRHDAVALARAARCLVQKKGLIEEQRVF